MSGCLGDALLPKWWRDKEQIEQELAAHGTLAGAARAHGIAPSTVTQGWNQVGSRKLPPGITATVATDGDGLEVDVDKLGDIGKMLRDRGLDPEDWVVVRAIANTWEGFSKDDTGQPQVVPLKQLKVFLRRRMGLALLQPAKVTPLKAPKPRAVPKREGRLFFLYGDDQRPNVDRAFEAAKLDWITQNQPDEIIDLGDGMDMPTISGHKTNPAMNYAAQECINDYASWLYAVRCVAPNAAISILADNHVTGRLRDFQLANAAALYGVHPADITGLDDDLEPLMSVRRMLRLDELGVTYLAPPGDTHYAESQHEIIPGELVALHGYRTGSNLGKKFIDDYGCSVIYGHAHGQDVYVTDKNRRGVGRRKRVYAIGVGCGANVHGGGGFAPGADWQTCALTVTVFPDGGWTWDYLNFEDGVLRWRDQRYAA